MARIRADLLLVARGLAESRAKARAAIEAGFVRVDGLTVTRPSELIDEDASLEAPPAHPWVSRGGVKLAAALDAFGIDPRGRVCIDVGASTGGFTQVLLARGAARVYAVDVGTGQLHDALRGDQRVINLERTDARKLTRVEIPEAPSLVVCDASFIGAAKVLAIPLSLAAKDADLIVLIKPQFEIGPGKGGVLQDADAREAARIAIQEIDAVEGFRVRQVIDSPIRGGEGNLELFAWAQRP